MAYRTHENIQIRSILRRGLSLTLICAALSAQAYDGAPLEVVVTPGNAPQASAMNEDGVVEANAARVENGIVYLEYQAAPGTSYEALSAATR